MTLQADLAALAADAQTWDTISETLGAAGDAVNGLSLGTPQLSWAAEATGLTAEYASFQDTVSTRLGEGEKNTADMAAGLRLVKASYESTDASVRDDFVGLWDPVSG